MESVSEPNCRLSIVVPVYRSARILPELVAQVFGEMQRQGMADRFELLLVNDASPDDSWQVIRALAQSHTFIKGISLRINAGQHNAIMAGLNHISGNLIVMMDDDLQHPPEAIGRMLRELERGYDVCYTRYVSRKHPLWKRLGSRLNNWVATRLLNKPNDIYLSSFKATTREIVREMVKYNGPYAYVDGLILGATRSITAIDIEHGPRHEGDSNYNLRRSISLWMKMATSFSVLPLRLPMYAGSILFAGSMATIVFIVSQKLLHPEIPSGWASLIATVLFIGGVQTLFLGLIGEYLGRAYLKLNGKPQYVVGDKT